MAAELQKNSVLIIEDNIILCNELAKILRYEKFSIETAYDAVISTGCNCFFNVVYIV